MATNRKPRKAPPADPPVPPPPPGGFQPLTDDELRFAEEYAVDRNPSLAYKRAFGPTSARIAYANSREMLQRPHVAAEIRALRHEQTRRCRVEADLVLNEICAIAFSDIYSLYDPETGLLRMPRHIPLQTRKAIASVKISRERRYTVQGRKSTTTITDTVIEYKLWPKLDALEKLCRYLGLNTEIPPLDVLLNALPTPLAGQIRAAIAQGRGEQQITPIEVKAEAKTELKETPPPTGS